MTRQRLRELVAEYGVDWLEQLMRGDAVQPVPMKDGSIVYIPADVRTRLLAVQIALQASEGLMAAVPPGRDRQRVLRVVLADESKPREGVA